MGDPRFLKKKKTTTLRRRRKRRRINRTYTRGWNEFFTAYRTEDDDDDNDRKGFCGITLNVFIATPTFRHYDTLDT